MQRDHGAETTSAVHSRPPIAGLPTPAHPGRLPPRFSAAPRGTAAEDVSGHRDTPAGDLAFLARFAFGRY